MIKNKTARILCLSGFLLFCLVIPSGFEPETHSLEGCCSIQLSYGTSFWGCKDSKLKRIDVVNELQLMLQDI